MGVVTCIWVIHVYVNSLVMFLNYITNLACWMCSSIEWKFVCGMEWDVCVQYGIEC